MALVGRMPFAADFLPFCFVKFRKVCIASNRGVYTRQIQPVGARQRRAVNFRAADDEDFRVVTRQRKRLVQRMRNKTAIRVEIAVARDDNIRAFRQWFADGFVVFPPENNRVAGGQAAEMLEVVRQPPRQGVVDADNAVFRQRGNMEIMKS